MMVFYRVWERDHSRLQLVVHENVIEKRHRKENIVTEQWYLLECHKLYWCFRAKRYLKNFTIQRKALGICALKPLWMRSFSFLRCPLILQKKSCANSYHAVCIRFVAYIYNVWMCACATVLNGNITMFFRHSTTKKIYRMKLTFTMIAAQEFFI